MTSSGKLDRDGYLMMVRGLEQMANMYKHAHEPSQLEQMKRLFRDKGISAVSILSGKLLEKCRARSARWLKIRRHLLEKADYRPRAYFPLLSKRRRTRIAPGSKIHRLKKELSYPAERYFQDGRIAVYMAMFGSYDRIMDPLIQPDNIDYYMLSDKELPESSKWKALDPHTFIPQELLRDPILCNRWCKMHPHLIFPDYDTSIYLDSNLLVVSDLTPFVTFLDSFPVAMFQHWKRDCVYQEVQTCIEGMRDTRSNLLRHEKRLRTQGIPEHWGLLEAPVIARRHRDEECIALMDAWWENYLSGSRRDQLSLIETLWQKGIRPRQLGTLGKNLYLCNLIVKNDHRKQVRRR